MTLYETKEYVVPQEDRKERQIGSMIYANIKAYREQEPFFRATGKGIVLDVFVKSDQEKQALLKQLFADSDINWIEIYNYCKPWYITLDLWERSVFPETWRIAHPYILNRKDIEYNCRPYGTPQELQGIDNIWTSEDECRARWKDLHPATGKRGRKVHYA